MLSTILLGILFVAALLAAGACRLGLSPWWIFLPASIAVAIALGTSSDVSSCTSADSVQALFGFAILFAVGFFATAAFTALFDGVRLASRGEKGQAIRRVVPLLTSVGLGFGTLVLWVVTVVACLE
jgi:hypothetical protein